MSTIANDLYSIKTEIANLKDKKENLSHKKRELELEIRKLNNRVIGVRLPPDEYKGICRKQQRVRELIADVEREMSPIKSELRHWYAMEDESRANANLVFTRNGEPQVAQENDVRSEISLLRNKYLSFAEDGTRVNSMRLLAA